MLRVELQSHESGQQQVLHEPPSRKCCSSCPCSQSHCSRVAVALSCSSGPSSLFFQVFPIPCAAVNGFPAMGASLERDRIAGWTFKARSYRGGRRKPCARAGPACAMRMCLHLQITSLGLGMGVLSACFCLHRSRGGCRLSPNTPGFLPAVSAHLLSYPAAAQVKLKTVFHKCINRCPTGDPRTGMAGQAAVTYAGLSSG